MAVVVSILLRCRDSLVTHDNPKGREWNVRIGSSGLERVP